jgi:hypothetical protein
VAARVSKSVCRLLIVVLICQILGCAGEPKNSPLTDVPAIGDSDIALRRYHGEDTALAGNEVLLFGRVQIREANRAEMADLSFDSALFLTAQDAPHKPIPLWNTAQLRKASKPFEPDKDGFFAAIVPTGEYHLQVVYRSSEAGWLAIDPGVRIRVEQSGLAVHIGELRLQIDPAQIAHAKAGRATADAVRVDRADEYEVDYAELKKSYSNAAAFPVRRSPVEAAPGEQASAIVSTVAPPAGSEKSPVVKIISGAALIVLGVVLFAAYLVLALVSGFGGH